MQPIIIQLHLNSRVPGGNIGHSRICVFAALALGAAGSLWGSGPAIGEATANGAYSVDKAQIVGTSALYDGARVQTGAAPSRVRLRNGSQIDLNANSSVVVRGTEAVLEKGSSQFGAASGYSLQARTLRIETDGAGAKAVVRLTGERNVLVQAANGPVRVFSKTGVLVALMDRGMGASFDPYAAPPDDFDMSGCLLRSTQSPLFGLAVANQLYQVAGPDLAGNVGNRVHITGARSASPVGLPGASASVTVNKIDMMDVGGCRAAAASFPNMTAEKLAAEKRPPVDVAKNQKSTKGPGGSASHNHTPAIIAGVAVAAGGGAVALVVMGKSK
jgi:hypothetical protein